MRRRIPLEVDEVDAPPPATRARVGSLQSLRFASRTLVFAHACARGTANFGNFQVERRGSLRPAQQRGDPLVRCGWPSLASPLRSE